jgi:hypothetical protein
VGLSCEGFVEKLMALLTAIEASCIRVDLASISRRVNRGNMELKRLVCSINYDSQGGSSSCGRGKSRGFSVLNEA